MNIRKKILLSLIVTLYARMIRDDDYLIYIRFVRPHVIAILIR